MSRGDLLGLAAVVAAFALLMLAMGFAKRGDARADEVIWLGAPVSAGPSPVDATYWVERSHPAYELGLAPNRVVVWRRR